MCIVAASKKKKSYCSVKSIASMLDVKNAIYLAEKSNLLSLVLFMLQKPLNMTSFKSVAKTE